MTGWWAHRHYSGIVETGAEMIGIIGRVGDEVCAGHVGDQLFSLGDIANLTAGEDEP